MRRIAYLVLAAGALLLAVAASAQARYVYVGNEEANTVSAFDTTTGSVAATIAMPEGPLGIAVTPDGSRAYVADTSVAAVSVIDTTTNQLVGAPIPVGAGPRGVAISGDGSRVYVADSAAATVSVIEAATSQVVATVGVGSNPRSIAITPDGTRAYVVDAGSESVSVIDTATSQVLVPPIPVGAEPEAIAVTPDGTRAYVTDVGDNTVSVIETATDQVVATIPVGTAPAGIAISLDGTRAYVADFGSDDVRAIDTATNQVVGAPIAIPKPTTLAVAPDGTSLYVASLEEALFRVDLPSGQVAGAPAKVGEDPRGIAVVPDQAPTARLNASAKGVAASFASDSSDPDLSAGFAGYLWDFGDGAVASTPEPYTTHAYRGAGFYAATLTVADGEGCPGFVFTGQTVSCTGPSTATATTIVPIVQLGRLRRNKRNGTARLTIHVPGAGRLALRAKGISFRRIGGRSAGGVIPTRGPVAVRVLIRARGKAQRRLRRHGRLRASATITFAATGGGVNRQYRAIRLRRRHGH